MVINKITQENIQHLLSTTPEFVSSYTLHYYSTLDTIPQSFYRRLVEIERFLKYYAANKEPNHTDILNLTIRDLEVVPINLIQEYLKEYSNIRAQASSIKTTISYLSSFWSYFTNYSFTIERGKPIFYRHAFDEWKIAYSSTYEAIKKGEQIPSGKKEIYSEEELKRILDFIDHSYVMTLDTQKKVDNWDRDKERNIAIIALLMGTGITLEEMSLLSVRDIDMRKKKIIVNRNRQSVELPILDFSAPYLTTYLAYRRQWWVADKTESALFLNQKKRAATIPLFSTVIHNINKAYHKKISARILQDSHGYVIYQRTNNFFEVQNAQGLKSLNSLTKYIK